MNRLELLPENDVVATLKKALDDIEQIKQKQFIGSDSLRPQILSSNKTYDFTAELDTFNPIPPLYYVAFIITFTADNQLNPYTRPFAELFDLSGTPFPYSSLDLYNVNELTQASLSPYVDDKTTVQQFIVRSASQFRLKLYLQASDKGNYSLNVIFGTPAP